MLNLTLELDGKLTTVNKIYKIGRGGHVYLAPEVKAFRQRVAPIVEKAMETQRYHGGPLRVTIDVHMDWFNKGVRFPPTEAEVKVMDIDNFIKATIDSVFPPAKINDKMIFKLVINKRQYQGEPFVALHIRELYGDELERIIYGNVVGGEVGTRIRVASGDDANDSEASLRTVRGKRASSPVLSLRTPVGEYSGVSVQNRRGSGGVARRQTKTRRSRNGT